MPGEEKKKNSYVSFIVVLLLIAGGIWLLGNRDKLSDTKSYITFFTDVEGLTVSSQVSINGAIIGKVSEAVVSDSGILVTIVIEPDVALRKGTTAKLISAGMAGGREISLTQGLSKEVLAEGSYITGIDSKDILSKDGQVGSALNIGRSALKTTDSIFREFSTLVSAAAIRDVRFELNKLDKRTDEASQKSKAARGKGDEFESTIHGINESSANLAADSKEWTASITDIEKQSEGLVQSTAELGENMRGISASLKKLKPLFDKTNDKDNALGKMLNDKQSYHTTTKQMSEADKTAKEVMDRPSAYWFAIFGSNR